MYIYVYIYIVFWQKCLRSVFVCVCVSSFFPCPCALFLTGGFYHLFVITLSALFLFFKLFCSWSFALLINPAPTLTGGVVNGQFLDFVRKECR